MTYSPTIPVGRKKLSALIVFLSLLIGGCFDSGTASKPAHKYVEKDKTNRSLNQDVVETVPNTPTIIRTAAPTNTAPVARILGENITPKMLESMAQMRFYDLDWARFQLQQEVLDNLIADTFSDKAAQPEDVNIYLTPPMPPRIKVIDQGQPRFGNDQAAIKIQIFCSFQSIHCARMMPVYDELWQRYPGKLQFIYYDYPQNFHRYARPAANAARCAIQGKNDHYQAFQKALYANQDRLKNSFYRQMATQLKLDIKSFEKCIKQLSFKPQIEANVKLGEELGLGNVPVAFINGLYVKGPQATSIYSYFIDQELQRLGQSAQPADTPAPVPTPVQVQTEKQNEPQQTSPTQNQSEQSSGENNDPDFRVTGNEYQGRNVIAAAGQTPLSREWLNAKLQNQYELEQKFTPAEHVVEGVHLMRLEKVEDNEFYQTLGLESGDVVMRVNDQWVHEGENPLFNALGEQQLVSVIIMRKGLPVRYDYAIQ